MFLFFTDPSQKYGKKVMRFVCCGFADDAFLGGKVRGVAVHFTADFLPYRGRELNVMVLHVW
jgi:hypothetical protein